LSTHSSLISTDFNQQSQALVFEHEELIHRASDESSSSVNPAGPAQQPIPLMPENPGNWSICLCKRIFDVSCVLLALPLFAPLMLLVAMMVRFTSSGPVLFTQKRVGRHGHLFTILKFRTMKHLAQGRHRAVTTAGNQPFTPIGPFLRRWKLDELPQLFNVLVGDMSLVGPRPKLPEHRVADLKCRPGITGAATLAFAHEEAILARLPKQQLDELYQSVVLPAKHNLDVTYMTSASLRSDLKLILDTVLRRWNNEWIEELLAAHIPAMKPSDPASTVFHFSHAALPANGEPATAVAPPD
jgi:lipopolysaccharide/colanic/teichoic acid biosynthesis glycosyltransferase